MKIVIETTELTAQDAHWITELISNHDLKCAGCNTERPFIDLIMCSCGAFVCPKCYEFRDDGETKICELCANGAEIATQRAKNNVESDACRKKIEAQDAFIAAATARGDFVP